jgi:hypothetical protein
MIEISRVDENWLLIVGAKVINVCVVWVFYG